MKKRLFVRLYTLGSIGIMIIDFLHLDDWR